MSWGSTIPTAITALVNGLTTALAPTEVINGQRVSGALLTEAVTVAFQDDNNPQAVTFRFEQEGFAAAPSREAYTVNCAVQVVTGNSDYLPSRTRVFDLLGLVGGWLTANPTLGVPGVLLAQLGSGSLTELPGPTETVLTLPFGVAVDAYTTT